MDAGTWNARSSARGQAALQINTLSSGPTTGRLSAIWTPSTVIR